MTFDANSTTIRLVDDNGGTSAWAYDLQDHQTTMTFHDGATTIDSMDRLIQYQRGTLDSGGASITTPIGLPNTDAQRAYALDGLGNWKNTAFTPEDGASETELRTHNKLNQIVAFGVPTASTPITYDQGNNVSTANPTRGNGNIANDGTLTYMYDALNRLITVTRISDSAVLGTYAYDALGRRIYAGTGPYLYDGQQIVEELVGGTTSLQYAWGQYIDEPVQLNAVQPQGPQSVTGVNYLLSDLLYRSAALTAGDRSILEAYDTDAYGRTLLFSGPGTDSTWFTNDDTQATYSACRYVFTGREYDAATGLYFYRARYYSPALGRFSGRDPLSYAGGINVYRYVSCMATALLDPAGVAPATIPGQVWINDGPVIWSLQGKDLIKGPIKWDKESHLAVSREGPECYLERRRDGVQMWNWTQFGTQHQYSTSRHDQAEKAIEDLEDQVARLAVEINDYNQIALNAQAVALGLDLAAVLAGGAALAFPIFAPLWLKAGTAVGVASLGFWIQMQHANQMAQNLTVQSTTDQAQLTQMNRDLKTIPDKDTRDITVSRQRHDPHIVTQILWSVRIPCCLADL